MTTQAATPAAEWVALDALEPWDRNARQHSDDSTRKLVAGIRRFGFLVPLTAWRAESRIAAGHGRRLAMLALLREDPAFIPRNAPPGVGPGMVPVMFEDFATEAQFKAFAIADNRQAKNAEDDDEAVAAVLAELDAQGIEFDGMGFDDDEIAELLNPESDEDDPFEGGVDDMDEVCDVMVECADENEQGRALELLHNEGFTCRALTS
jgi:ParB-like chromosome segregation protein Spo0J